MPFLLHTKNAQLVNVSGDQVLGKHTLERSHSFLALAQAFKFEGQVINAQIPSLLMPIAPSLWDLRAHQKAADLLRKGDSDIPSKRVRDIDAKPDGTIFVTAMQSGDIL